MDKVLLNLARRQLCDFCKSMGWDISGSHCEKAGRGFQYKLVRTNGGEMIAHVRFTKNSVPEFSYPFPR
jgi:hypothetical protein